MKRSKYCAWKTSAPRAGASTLKAPHFDRLQCSPVRPRFSDGRRCGETRRRYRRSTAPAISSDQRFSHKVSSSMLCRSFYSLLLLSWMFPFFYGVLFGSVTWETHLSILKAFICFVFMLVNWSVETFLVLWLFEHEYSSWELYWFFGAWWKKIRESSRIYNSHLLLIVWLTLRGFWSKKTRGKWREKNGYTFQWCFSG